MRYIQIGAIVAMTLFSSGAFAQFQGGGLGGGRMGGGGRQRDQSMNNESAPRKVMEPADIAKKQTEWMKKSLVLTEEQEKQIAPVNLKYALQQKEEFEALMVQNQSGAMPDRDMVIHKMEGINLAQDNEIKPVLTAPQWELYKKKRNKMRNG